MVLIADQNNSEIRRTQDALEFGSKQRSGGYSTQAPKPGSRHFPRDGTGSRFGETQCTPA
jgi:hypothetical protein